MVTQSNQEAGKFVIWMNTLLTSRTWPLARLQSHTWVIEQAEMRARGNECNKPISDSSAKIKKLSQHATN